MKVLAPGKLILTGEHAVVYGNPAIAMAVNRYASAHITRESASDVSFDFSDLAYRSRLTLAGLQDLKNRIKRKYHRFIRGEYTIRQVLHKPFELAQVAMGLISESLNLSLPHGVNVQVKSDIPMGCGMGSSAATILAVMQAISNYLNVPISQETLFKLALEAENLQHGHSSGLDLHVAQRGGCLYLEGNHVQSRPVPTMEMYLINTGTPQSSTGECVTHVSSHFKSKQLNEDFASVAKAMDQALNTRAVAPFQDTIRANHQLLTTIGVVPGKVNQFVSELEQQGMAAKICGAGAVSGDAGGAVLAVGADASALMDLSKQYGYTVIPIAGETRGVHVI